MALLPMGDICGIFGGMFVGGTCGIVAGGAMGASAGFMLEEVAARWGYDLTGSTVDGAFCGGAAGMAFGANIVSGAVRDDVVERYLNQTEL